MVFLPGHLKDTLCKRHSIQIDTSIKQYMGASAVKFFLQSIPHHCVHTLPLLNNRSISQLICFQAVYYESNTFFVICQEKPANLLVLSPKMMVTFPKPLLFW